MIIRLDFDDKTEEEVMESLRFAASIVGIEIKDIILRRSTSGNLHAYVYLVHQITPLEEFLFRYYAFEDRRRINADIRRYKFKFPQRYSFLFYEYVNKPNLNRCGMAKEFEYWDFVLSYAVRHYPLGV